MCMTDHLCVGGWLCKDLSRYFLFTTPQGFSANLLRCERMPKTLIKLQRKEWDVSLLHVECTHTVMHRPAGMCGRRAARWLTWTHRLVCGWIPTGPCTSPRRGRATSERTPAGWHRWAATTPAAPTSESGRNICLPSYLTLLFPLFCMIDGCFPLQFIILTMSFWLFNCVILHYSLSDFAPSLSLFVFPSHSCALADSCPMLQRTP